MSCICLIDMIWCTDYSFRAVNNNTDEYYSTIVKSYVFAMYIYIFPKYNNGNAVTPKLLSLTYYIYLHLHLADAHVQSDIQ